MTTGDWLCKRLWNLFFLYDFTPNLASKTSYQMNGNPPTPLHWIRWLCALMGAKWRGTRNAHENIKQGSTNSCPSMCPMSNLISHFYLYFFTKPHWLITKHIYKWSEGPLRNKCYIWACDPPPQKTIILTMAMTTKSILDNVMQVHASLCSYYTHPMSNSLFFLGFALEHSSLFSVLFSPLLSLSPNECRRMNVGTI